MNESAGKARFSKFKAGSQTVESALSETHDPVIASANEFADTKHIGLPSDLEQKRRQSDKLPKEDIGASTAPATVAPTEEKRQKRTSIIIDLEIYQTLSQLKQAGMTIGDVINDALHEYLNKKYPRYVELARKIIELQD